MDLEDESLVFILGVGSICVLSERRIKLKPKQRIGFIRESCPQATQKQKNGKSSDLTTAIEANSGLPDRD